MAIQPGQVHHHRYKFEQIIGQGAFGVTWQGEHLLLRRAVAIKVIDAANLDESSLQRVIRECQIGGDLSSRHVVHVLDAYREAGDLCIVMEFMAGGNLKTYLADHPPTLAQGLRWGLDLAEALAVVHERGIIHRDLKPANILLTEDGQVKIADFGIAHLPDSDLTGAYQPGTPAYRSPEQEANQPVDAAADVYALCAVLFEIFIGEKFNAYKGLTLTEWRRQLHQQLATRFPTPPKLALTTLTNVLTDGLTRDKSRRSTLPEVQQGLAEVLAQLTSEGIPVLPPPTGAGQDETAVDQTPVARLGRYELQVIIGRGGMGTVYKAYDPRIDRMVALKRITIVDPSWRDRFQQEARIAGRLNHPHIVTVYDVGEEGDTAYIVMELVEGQTLVNVLQARLDWPDAVKLLLPVCEALAFAHHHKIIHRDVKPANILLAADGRVKLTDFGIARMEASTPLTVAGAVMGTPLYMAPEQIAGQPADERADIFALGLILFELITGHHPLLPDDTTTAPRSLLPIQLVDFRRLEGAAPPSLQAAIRRAIAEKPAERFASVNHLYRTLTTTLERETPAPAAPGQSTTTVTIAQVELHNRIVLSEDEQSLLMKAFSDYDRVYLESELSRTWPEPDGSADKASRLLVALPVRQGQTLARVLVKLAAPALLRAEWKAFQEYVDGILPLVTAHIQDAPLLSADRKLSLLRYTFSGDVGERQAETLLAYYYARPGPDTAALLERNIFRTVAPNWWLNRETTRFTVRQEYGRLLPVHLAVERIDNPTAQPVGLKADIVKVHSLQNLEAGQWVQLQGFRVQTVHADRQTMILEGPPPPGIVTEPVRLLLCGLTADELHYRPGDLAPDFTGQIIAAQRQLLIEAARIGLPDADLAEPVLTIGTSRVTNPVSDYDKLLERSVAGMRSIIHGGLTLDSILVEPESGLTWLINFAATRLGHNIYDFLQLEAQLITRILPALVTPSLNLNDEVIAMARSLHTALPPATAPHPVLQKPYEVLRQIRKLAGQCLLNPEKWDEYYLGLTMMLLGALPGSAGGPAASRFTLAWAAVATELIDRPLRPPAHTEPPLLSKSTNYIWYVIGAVGVILAVIVGGAAFLMNQPAPAPTAVVIAPTATATSSPSPTSTATPTATSTPAPTNTASPTSTSTLIPGPAEGILTSDLPVYSGPDRSFAGVANITEGTQVEVEATSKQGDWLNITWPGGSGWVDADFVAFEGPVNLPMVNPPAATFTPTGTSTATPRPATPTITLTPTPTGSPTPDEDAPRQIARETNGYKMLSQSIGFRPTNSESFSPDGSEIAITEGAKLYVIGADGSHGDIFVEEDGDIRPVEGVVWSPNGALIAFVADRKRNCVFPCRRVGIVVRVDKARGPFYLEPPEGFSMGLPRWTQGGKLLVNIFKSDPASGTVYLYDPSGRGQVASGEIVLSSSTEGQKWSPWLPGKTWRVDQSQPNSYYND